MRKLKLQMQVSLDGFVAGPNGEMDWVMFDWDEALMAYVTQITDPVDTIVLGRNLAQGFIPHWEAKPAYEDSKSIRKMIDTPKVVFTKTLQKSAWAGVELATGDLVEEITRLKQQPGNDIIVYGGVTLVADLVKHNLIDEYHLFVNPVALGKGLSIFSKVETNPRLNVLQSQAFSCGITLLCYESVNRT